MKKEFQKLFKAVVNGDIEYLQENITRQNVNYVEPETQLTLLMVATSLKRESIIYLLLSKHACISILDKGGYNIIHRAVWEGNVNILHALLFYNSFATEIKDHKPSKIPLSLEEESKKEWMEGEIKEETEAEDVEHEKEWRCETENTSYKDWMTECKTWRPDVQKLINEAHRLNNLTPLSLAIIKNDKIIVKYLIEYCQIDIFEKSISDINILDLGAICGSVEIVGIILKNLCKNKQQSLETVKQLQYTLEELSTAAETVEKRKRLHQIHKLISQHFK